MTQKINYVVTRTHTVEDVVYNNFLNGESTAISERTNETVCGTFRDMRQLKSSFGDVSWLPMMPFHKLFYKSFCPLYDGFSRQDNKESYTIYKGNLDKEGYIWVLSEMPNDDHVIYGALNPKRFKAFVNKKFYVTGRDNNGMVPIVTLVEKEDNSVIYMVQWGDYNKKLHETYFALTRYKANRGRI